MQEKSQEQQAPEVRADLTHAPEIQEEAKKAAAKAKPKGRTTSKAQAAKQAAEKKQAKPALSAATAKQLQELTTEINRIESLKADRLAIMQKERERGVQTTEIAEAAGYSVARTRQLLGK